MLALVETSCSFPDTTARTLTPGGPTEPTAEASAPSVTGFAFPNEPLSGRSTTQTPTPVEDSATTTPSAGAPGGGLTTTVMPSTSCVLGGGCTCRPAASGSPASSNRPSTLADRVWTSTARPPTTSVTSFAHAPLTIEIEETTPSTTIDACSARRCRSRRTRVGRTTHPPSRRGGPSGEAARPFTGVAPERCLRSHGGPPYRTLNVYCNLETERTFAQVTAPPGDPEKLVPHCSRSLRRGVRAVRPALRPARRA